MYIHIWLLELLETIALVMFQGDLGGPLVIWRNNAWTQIGIVSFVRPAAGVDCAIGSPSGYARVTAFLDWIQDNTGVGI
jgi:secreted trypsin-like serine protease